ncbi:TetR/AcrR family transcriptional regulator [Gulosibacter faecalis]|uniref:TetR/AcrR family transcriptional regulator n=1 Tax=Gulosibacter faecalis TaxID=272240 RepID=A0ABW5UXD4_9MICO|nr:TetR/AcrR family transcriptional regulator [Gulosibacter faecalis]
MTSGDNSRNAERTRLEILAAARDVLAERGTATSLQHVATAAGISKGGLLHHFASKDDLLFAVVETYFESIQRGVRDRIDLSENRPGKALRAYVRALCEVDSPIRQEFARFADFWSYLCSIPGVQELSDADTAHWHEFLAGDGLDPDRILLVRYAAEGLATASSYDNAVLHDGLDRARPMLLALCEPAPARTVAE